MLGKHVRVRVTNPMNSHNFKEGYNNNLNFGIVDEIKKCEMKIIGAFILGIDHPVRNFEGRVIATLKNNESSAYLIVAPKNSRYIIGDIKDAVSFVLNVEDYKIECLYECSCGAVVYRSINDEYRFLLIKNKRSAHWGFPKGHIEAGESKRETAMREVLEETGIHIDILPDFTSKSEYTIQGRVEKAVTIFLATTSDTQTVIQKEEIEDYIWLNYKKAMQKLRFENDKNILRKAYKYMVEKGIVSEVADG
ncbi:MAG TPA: NUDIX domain-containing protein [Clostridia bacterium]|nr:NUDIX domain-containing protein [Clostridia bacterium]